jgi:hypothetical protein
MRHVVARPGDALICPFECDDCCFYRIQHYWPKWKEPQEILLGAYIRQANLDAFWARQSSTVSHNLREFKSQARIGQDLGFVAFDPLGPFNAKYDSGMRAAIGVLMKAQRVGRHEAKVKFSAARKARTVHTNMFRTSAQGYELSMYIRTDKRRSIMSKNPTDSEFYTLFTRGLEARVGQRVKRDRALSIEIIVELQLLSEAEWEEAGVTGDEAKQRSIAEWAVYFLCTFCHSLRGWEGVKAVISMLRTQIVDEDEAGALGVTPHLGLPLYGRFKSCGNSSSYLLCMIAGKTASGLTPVRWAQRLLMILDRTGVESDWLFQHEDGRRKRMSDFNEVFYDMLYDIQRRMPELISEDTDVAEDFHLARSFRRGATTRAQLADVPEAVVEWVNRWGTGTEILVKGPMRIIYSERKLMLEHYLKFSRAL